MGSRPISARRACSFAGCSEERVSPAHGSPSRIDELSSASQRLKERFSQTANSASGDDLMHPGTIFRFATPVGHSACGVPGSSSYEEGLAARQPQQYVCLADDFVALVDMGRGRYQSAPADLLDKLAAMAISGLPSLHMMMATRPCADFH